MRQVVSADLVQTGGCVSTGKTRRSSREIAESGRTWYARTSSSSCSHPGTKRVSRMQVCCARAT
eukprot:1638866-Rhodomonas_salina.4